ncbi:MAG: fused MFS/spermidine synthase [Burkholderiaceae bacterium]|nr:fused MFS/spermidine synthase [Burkholderiaceae bacterium]
MRLSESIPTAGGLQSSRPSTALGRWRVAGAFFLSGFAALVYQVAWQRLLFVVVGVDIESVTIVVSTFMLGMGVGAVLGGWIADRVAGRILVAFCLAEIAIACYGLVSVGLLVGSAEAFSGLSRPAAALLCFGLLLIPTVCMGATLPMLVAHAFRSTRHIGVSTGTLYFVNTLGAACGALAVGFLLLYWFDLRQVVQFAAGANLLASAIVASAVVWRARP